MMLGMSIELLTNRYSKQIAGIISCYDRILIVGTLPKICYATGVTRRFEPGDWRQNPPGHLLIG
jgi:hypothetical protein